MIYLVGLLIFNIFVVYIGNILPKKKNFLILEIIAFILPIILLSSFKSINVGTDTSSYYATYKQAYDFSSIGKYTGDKGFLFLQLIFNNLKAPFFVFLLFVNTIIYGGIALFSYKKSNNPLLLMFFAVYFGILGFALSGIRQALAIGIILIGYSFFDQEKPISIISPLIFIGIAMTIHITSIFAILIGALLFAKYNKKSFLYFTLSFLVLCAISPFIYSAILAYLKDKTYYPSLMDSGWTLIFYLLFGVLTVLLTNTKVLDFINSKLNLLENSKLIRKTEFNNCDENNSNYVSYTTTTAYIYYPILVLFIGIYSVVFARIIYYLVPFTGLYITNLMNNEKIKPFPKMVLNALLILFLCIYFIYSVLIKNPIHVANYEFGPMF